MGSHTIVPPFQLYPLNAICSIITGTPFLYLRKNKMLVMGDIHLGQESEVYADSNKIGKASMELIDLLNKTIDRLKISTVVCNGDIKHHTSTIKIQELEELKYFTTTILKRNIDLVFIKGNHDELLEFMFPFVNLDHFQLHDHMNIADIHICHGHDIQPNLDTNTIIIAHEHPSFSFRGLNRSRVKLPAFVTLKAAMKEVIILPHASAMSVGVDYPPRRNQDFLSPFLQKFGDIGTMEIFPFDPKYGLFELPPVRHWRS